MSSLKCQGRGWVSTSVSRPVSQKLGFQWFLTRDTRKPWAGNRGKTPRQHSTTFRRTFSELRNVMRYHKGTLFNQKHAVRYNLSNNISCPLCTHVDSALHMLSGCQHTMIRNMITERHNKACRIILQALAKGKYGANLLYRCWQCCQIC